MCERREEGLAVKFTPIMTYTSHVTHIHTHTPFSLLLWVCIGALVSLGTSAHFIEIGTHSRLVATTLDLHGSRGRGGGGAWRGGGGGGSEWKGRDRWRRMGKHYVSRTPSSNTTCNRPRYCLQILPHMQTGTGVLGDIFCHTLWFK